MKAYLSLIFIICFVSSMFSQTSYDLTLRVGQSLTNKESYNTLFNYYQEQQISDDKYVRSNFTASNAMESRYTKLSRIEIAGNITFSLASNFHLRTGLGMSIQTISVENNFLSGSSTINSLDTLNGSISEFTTFNFKPCQYENSYLDIIVPNNTSKIYSLLIPLEIEYDIIKKMSVRLGGYLQSPISSIQQSYSIRSIELEEFEEFKLCKYELNIDKDTSGSRFNDMVLGLSLGTSYQLTQRIGMEVLYRHSFSKTYSSNDNIFYFNNNNGGFKNRSVLLGISYRFDSHHIVENKVKNNLENL